MKLFFSIPLSVFFIFFAVFLKAQYAGIYTVGCDNCDWPNPSNAINAIHQSGTSGEVWLMVKPGVYSLGSTTHFQPEHRVHFVGESGQAVDVQFEPAANANMSFGWCHHLSFKHLFFNAPEKHTCLAFSSPNSIHFDSCMFRAGPQNNAVALKFTGGLATGTNHFRDNEVLRGEVDFRANEDGHITNNNLSGALWVRGWCKNISNNYIQGSLFFWAHSKAFDNYIVGNASASNAHEVEFYRNWVGGSTGFSSGVNILVHSNVLKGSFSIGGSYALQVINNHIYGNCSITHFNGIHNSFHFYHNTIGPGAWFRTWYHGVAGIKNNNFGGPVYWNNGAPAVNTPRVASNNYYPEAGQYGVDNYHFDPMYLSDDSLVVTNPLLVGKGAASLPFSEFTTLDINGEIRNGQPTIGANEYCAGLDTVAIFCGASVSTMLCGLPWGSVVQVEPEEHVRNPEWNYPLLEPPTSTTYTLTDTLTGISTQLHVEVMNAQYGSTDSLSILCGYAATLYEFPQSSQNPTFHWTPEGEVLPWLQTTWYALPESSTTYYLHIENPHCGDHFDTIHIEVTPLPRALPYFELNWEGPDIQFTHNSYCTDSVIWHFGDGTTSTEDEPLHVYQASGLYFMSLVAMNELGTDTANRVVQIFSSVGTTNEVSLSDVLLYPNPHSGQFRVEWPTQGNTVQAEVYNLQGLLLWQEKYAVSGVRFEAEIQIPELSAGSYVLRLSDGFKSTSVHMSVLPGGAR